jgi:hypothetical protein
VSWSQRLGYLLELAAQAELVNVLKPFVREHARNFAPLRRAARIAGSKRNAEWKLVINTEIEPDQ